MGKGYDGCQNLGDMLTVCEMLVGRCRTPVEGESARFKEWHPRTDRIPGQAAKSLIGWDLNLNHSQPWFPFRGGFAKEIQAHI